MVPMPPDDDDRAASWKKATADFVQGWERSVAVWWDRVLESPEVLAALNKTLAGQVDQRRNLQQLGQRWMERMNLPTRADLTRLARIATLLEERLLAIDDRLLDLQDRVARAETEAVRARVDAAEARVELLERLAALEARLVASGSAERSEGTDG